MPVAFPRHFEAWKEVSMWLLHRSLVAPRCGPFRHRFWPEIDFILSLWVAVLCWQDGRVTWQVLFLRTAAEVSRVLALSEMERYTPPLPAVPSERGIDALHTDFLWCVQGLVARGVGSVRESCSAETQAQGGSGSDGGEEDAGNGRLHWTPCSRRRNSSPASQT